VSVGSETVARPGAKARRGTLPQRVLVWLLSIVTWLACRLPERPLVALAELAGDAWYRADRDRAAQGRRNLRRVVARLAENDSGSDVVRRAAGDPAVLERLLRAAFRHQARYYLEVARTPGISSDFVRRRLLVETPEVVAEAFNGEGPVIFVGLHFGAIELPALFLADRAALPPTAPMETIDNQPLQDYFVRTRGAVGLRIVGLREARRELLAALRRGESVGAVADRDLTGGGIDTDFFGAPAPLPAGPALLAMEAGARVYVVSVRRGKRGRYVGRLERVPLPDREGARRRDRVTGFLAAEARAFERAIAVAPEQWWGAFFPVWPDLEGRDR
jgi:phosphatidylinositol dimannoside acyltransferase